MEVSAFSKNCLLVAKFQVCAGKLLSYELQDFVGWQELTQSVFGTGLSTLLASLRWTGLSQMLSQIPHLAPHSVNTLDRSSARPGASHVIVQRSQLAWAGVQLVLTTDTAELLQAGFCSSSAELQGCSYSIMYHEKLSLPAAFSKTVTELLLQWWNFSRLHLFNQCNCWDFFLLLREKKVSFSHSFTVQWNKWCKWAPEAPCSFKSPPIRTNLRETCGEPWPLFCTILSSPARRTLQKFLMFFAVNVEARGW